MRAVIQRVSSAAVRIDGRAGDTIERGLLVLLAAEESDTGDDVTWLSGKIARLRIFEDDAGMMNRSVVDVKGAIMVISQFTLFASTRKGNRPSFIRAAKPETAIPLYEAFLRQMSTDLAAPVASGVFGADMQVTLTNDGPVTIIMDSKNRE